MRPVGNLSLGAVLWVDHDKNAFGLKRARLQSVEPRDKTIKTISGYLMLSTIAIFLSSIERLGRQFAEAKSIFPREMSQIMKSALQCHARN